MLFRSSVSYLNRKIACVIGKIEGSISNKPKGSNGFGYDPIFIPDGETKTYANVSDKDNFSHRAASLKKFSDWFMHKQ